MATPREIDQWLQEGIAAAKAGHAEQARFRLLDVVEQQQTNEVAWYWLFLVFDRVEDKRTCLENLIIINPQNQWAKQELLNYLADPVAGRPLVFGLGTVPALVDANGNGQADPGEPGYVLVIYQLTAGSGVTPGEYVNRAAAIDVCSSCYISNEDRCYRRSDLRSGYHHR